MKLKFSFIACVILALLVFSSPGLANNQAVWVYGKVTRSPHQIDSRTYIQVDGELYKILPDIRITYRYERNRGAFNERKARLFAIGKSQEVAMRVRDNEVHQIILY